MISPSLGLGCVPVLAHGFSSSVRGAQFQFCSKRWFILLGIPFVYLKKIAQCDSCVKFYLGKNEDCSLGDVHQVTEKLLQRGEGRGQ